MIDTSSLRTGVGHAPPPTRTRWRVVNGRNSAATTGRWRHDCPPHDEFRNALNDLSTVKGTWFQP